MSRGPLETRRVVDFLHIKPQSGMFSYKQKCRAAVFSTLARI